MDYGAIATLLSAVLGGFIGSIITAKSQAKVEKARLENENLRFKEKFQQEMKLAALDKRLQVHQEAYTHWLNVTRYMYNYKLVRPFLDQALNWWDKNCLYLFPEVALEFRRALLKAGNLESIRGGLNPDALVEYQQGIINVGGLIQSSMGLPVIGEDEIRRIVRDSPEPNSPTH